MASTRDRDEMLMADEMRALKPRRGARTLDPSREGLPTSDANFRPRTGSDAPPAMPERGGAIGKEPGAMYIAGETFKNVVDPRRSIPNTVAAFKGEGPRLDGTNRPQPKTPDQLLMADYPRGAAQTVGGTAPAQVPAAAPSPQSQTGPMGPIEPDILTLADTEQGRRDLAMLRKRNNVQTAELMGQSNRFSAFNPNNRNYSPDRGEMIMEREATQQQLATAQRASAGAPRYADSPNKSPEILLYEEQARNRQQQAVQQANTDQGARDQVRTQQKQLSDAEFERMLATENAGASMAKAGAANAETTAARARADADLAAAAIPEEANRENVMRMRGASPVYQPAVSRVAEGIKSLSGKAFNPGSGDSKEARRVLDAGIASMNQMPPELQRVAAAEILSVLEDGNLDLPKEAFEDAWFPWLVKSAAGLVGIETPTGRATSETQSKINRTLRILKDKAAASGVNPQMFNAATEAPAQ